MSEVKTIHDVGAISGRMLFFGGVYSNLQALQALKAWADSNGYLPANIVCTGDILGYCAQPVECINLVKEWGIHSIAGNVEIQLRNGEEDCGCDFKDGGRCDVFSRNWYAFARRKINRETISFLQTLPHHLCFTNNGKKYAIVHGSWFHTSDFIFKSTPWQDKKENFEAADADVIIAGHCGLPFADVKESRYWLNAGAIGMPANDGTDRVWFLTMEAGKDQGINYTFHHLQYNHRLASDLMRQNGLPLSYADTLGTGIWDNCEILPEEEAALQGMQIIL